MVEKLRQRGQLTCLTLGARGSLVISAGAVVEIAPAEARLVDATGAGDAYAAGFLYEITRGHDVVMAGHTASLWAARVISKHGAR